MTFVRLKFQKRRGAILLNVLIFLVVISILLAGMAKLMISDYSIVRVENDYANSLVVAEAGINYELRKISVDGTKADQKSSQGTAGASYTTAAGTFQVYVTQRNSDGTEPSPWTPGKNVWIYSTGGVNNLTRSVKVAAVAYTNTPALNYAVFGVANSSVDGTPTTIFGDVGTNAKLSFSGHPTVSGNVIFNGPTSVSGWQSPPNGSYRVIQNATPVIWPTVEAIALDKFGAQGLSYVASNNDNALATPPIVNNTINTSNNLVFYGKPGGANYYLTSMNCTGNAIITFNNTTGPITIWVGPSGASGTFTIRGGTAAIKMAQDPSKAVRVYCATTGDVTLTGTVELDAGIYNVNNAASGRVNFGGNQDVYGIVIANTFGFNGNPNVMAIQGYFSPTGDVLYYGIIPPWYEVGGIN
jgi:Tfp pilus assembly protein PilX